MIIKAFLNEKGVNSLLTGGEAEASSRPDKDKLIEVLLETDRYHVSPAVDAGNGIAYFTFGPRIRKSYPTEVAEKYPTAQEVKAQSVVPKVEVKS